jgi:uncharacterized protein HemX
MPDTRPTAPSAIAPSAIAPSAIAPSATGSALVLSALVGAVAGAAGLAWWLLSEAERRRQSDQQRRLWRLSRSQGLGSGDGSAEERVGGSHPSRSQAHDPEAIAEGPLRDRVLQLNRAIDEVRRQLEALQTHS